MKNTSKKLLIAFTALTSLAITSYAQPPHMIWDTAQNITSSDSDVSTVGQLVQAYHFSNSSDTTVNGVTFTNITSAMLGDYSLHTVTFGSENNALTETNSNYWLGMIGGSGGGGAAASLSPNYLTLLGQGVWTGVPNSLNLTLNGLTVGHTYKFQWWTSESSDISVMPWTLTQATDGNSITLNADPTGLQGGVGQFDIGTFTATTTSETIAFSNVSTGADTNSWGPLVNAYELRDTSVVPEPSSFVLLGVGAAGFALLRRKSARK